jgi:hypothetical protein
VGSEPPEREGEPLSRRAEVQNTGNFTLSVFMYCFDVVPAHEVTSRPGLSECYDLCLLSQSQYTFRLFKSED